MDSIQSKTNDAQIREFTSKIGNSIIITNEKDNEIVEQLLQYIESLLNEKNNLLDICSNLNNETIELQHKVSTELLENKKLLNEKEIVSKAVEEQKQDLLKVIRRSVGKKLSRATCPLDEIFDEDEMIIIKNTIEHETLNYYAKEIESNAKV